MGIAYFIFALYLLLSLWLIPAIPFIKNANLTKKETQLLLALKMFSGLACAFYFQRISSNVDYLEYNTEGKIRYQLLLSDPKLFFTDFSNDMRTYGPGGLFESRDSFWAYLRFNLLFKFIALLNLITRGNFYFNTTIFSTITFFGHIAFYRIFSEIYKGQKLKILLGCFALPSLLLYTACVHKDGIIFLCIGIISYAFYRILSRPRSLIVKHIFIICMGMTGIFLFRNYVIVALVPAMFIALFCSITPYKKWFVFFVSYLFFVAAFFLSGFSHSSLNLPAAVVQRKADFSALGEASTNIPMNELSPTVRSFISNFPQALNHYFLRPYLWEFGRVSVMLTAIELLFYQLLFLAFIFYGKRRAIMAHPFNIFGLTFVFNMALIIGYTIPNIGAIVRYRSIFWILIVCPLLCSTDWKRLFSFRKTILMDNG